MTILLIIVAAVILWIIMTARKRRNRLMFNAISELVESGQPAAILTHIYFEAALKFALQNGAKLEPGQLPINMDSLQFPLWVSGKNYYIYIARIPSGGTYLGITDAEESNRAFRERINGKN